MARDDQRNQRLSGDVRPPPDRQFPVKMEDAEVRAGLLMGGMDVSDADGREKMGEVLRFASERYAISTRKRTTRQAAISVVVSTLVGAIVTASLTAIWSMREWLMSRFQ